MSETTLSGELLAQVQPILERLTGENATRKARTILALVTAEALNLPMQWGLGSGNCARSTWLDRWSKEPETAEVYQAVRQVVIEGSQANTLDAVARAQAIIQAAAPKAAETLVALLESDSEMTARLAAESVLDRASKMTAAKVDNGGLNADDLARLAREAAAELAAWELDEDGGEWGSGLK